MTDTTPRLISPAKPPKDADVRSETLAEFAAILDDTAGRHVRFVETVTALHQARQQLAQVKAARAAAMAHVRKAYEIGHRAVGGTPYDIAESAPIQKAAYRAVDSGTAKKADAAAWRRAQVRSPWTQVLAPQAVAYAVPLLDAPEDRSFIPPAEAVTLYKEHPMWAAGRVLRGQEKYQLTRLEALAKEFGWSGDLKVFSDGWSARLSREAYSSDRLAEIEPELFDQLAVWKIPQATTRLYVKRRDSDVEGQEIDEFDGD